MTMENQQDLFTQRQEYYSLVREAVYDYSYEYQETAAHDSAWWFEQKTMHLFRQYRSLLSDSEAESILRKIRNEKCEVHGKFKAKHPDLYAETYGDEDND